MTDLSAGHLITRGHSHTHRPPSYSSAAAQPPAAPSFLFRYARVVWSRLEYEWWASHPPLKLLPPRYLWVPGAEIGAPFDDGHAVMSRADASVYLTRWEAPFEPSFLPYRPSSSSPSSRGHHPNMAGGSRSSSRPSPLPSVVVVVVVARPPP